MSPFQEERLAALTEATDTKANVKVLIDNIKQHLGDALTLGFPTADPEQARLMMREQVDHYLDRLRKMGHISTTEPKAGSYSGYTIVKGRRGVHYLVLRWTHGVPPNIHTYYGKWRRVKPAIRRDIEESSSVITLSMMVTPRLMCIEIPKPEKTA